MYKFTCNIAHCRDFGKLFNIALPYKSCMIACSASDNIDSVAFFDILNNVFINYKITLAVGILLHNSADNKWLLLNFFQHKVGVSPLLCIGNVNFRMKSFTLNFL